MTLGYNSHPIRIEERRLVPDTEGAGEFRGAPSSRVSFTPTHSPIRVLYQSDGGINAPQGARGGLAGAPSRNLKVGSANGECVELGAWEDLELEAGERIVGISCGGGGYGSPHRRDVRRVRADVMERYISSLRAERVYGVVLKPDGEVDEVATSRLRATLTKLP